MPKTKSLLFKIRLNYHENVIDHYENPRNVGSLDKKKNNHEWVKLGGLGANIGGD